VNDGYKAEFMYNQYIATKLKTGPAFDRWDYSPVKYWPNGIDAANAVDKPSNTATEGGIQKLSFFAYAPYTPNVTGNLGETITTPDGDGLDYPSDVIYGNYPAGLDKSKVFKTVAYDASATNIEKNGGVLGMTDWNTQKDPWLNFYLNSTSTKDGLDLLWGMRGQYTYDETDNDPNTTTDAKDLGKSYNVNLTKQSVDEKVRFLFKHALAKIGGSTKNIYDAEGWQGKPKQSGIKVVVDVDANSSNPNAGLSHQTAYFSEDFTNTKTLVTLKDVRIRDAKTYNDEVGTLTGTDAMSNLNTWGWFDIATGEWTNSGSKFNPVSGAKASSDTDALLTVTTSATGGNETTPGINSRIMEIGAYKGSTGTGKKVNNDGTWTNTDAVANHPLGVTTTPEPVYDNNADYPGIMLIPGATPQTLYITVDYFVRTADAQLAKGFSEVEQRITNKVDITGLEANKYYTLVIHLGLTSVKFEAVVADWAATDNATYNEDGTTNEGGESHMNGKSVWLPSNVVEESTTTGATASRNTTKEVTLAGNVTSYDLTVTGLVESNVVTASADNTSIATAVVTDPVAGAVPASGQVKTTVTLAPNNTGTLKTVIVTITEKDNESTPNTISTTTLIIHQSPGVLTLTATNANIGSDATGLEVALTNGADNVVIGAVGNIAITKTQADGTTIDLAAPSGIAITADPNNHKATATVSKNFTAKPVTYTVKVTQDGLEATCDIIQAAGEITVGATGGTDITFSAPNLQITYKDALTLTDPDWTVTINGQDRKGQAKFYSNASWLSINPTTGAISATENTTGAARNAVISIVVDGVVKTINVTQTNTAKP